MTDTLNKRLRRRTILSAIGGTTGACTLHTASASEYDSEAASTKNRSHGTNYTTIDSKPLGRVKPSDVVPRSIQSFNQKEQRAIRAAVESGSGSLLGKPTFPLGSVVTINDHYYEISIGLSKSVEKTVPTLNADRIEYRTAGGQEVNSLSELGEDSTSHIVRAIGKARYKAAQDAQGSTNDRKRVPDGPEYVFNPNESVPKWISVQSPSFIVEEKNEYYRLGYEKQQASVPVFEIKVIEVADSPQTFNSWFNDEYVALSQSSNGISTAERQIISMATADLYREQSPYSAELKSLFGRLGVHEQSSAKSYRYIRFDDALQYLTISQGVGC